MIDDPPQRRTCIQRPGQPETITCIANKSISREVAVLVGFVNVSTNISNHYLVIEIRSKFADHVSSVSLIITKRSNPPPPPPPNFTRCNLSHPPLSTDRTTQMLVLVQQPNSRQISTNIVCWNERGLPF